MRSYFEKHNVDRATAMIVYNFTEPIHVLDIFSLPQFYFTFS